MLKIRRGDERGTTRTEWLDSRHTFSFGDYDDPAYRGISILRVLNDDRVAPGAGFPPHGHRDMEIVSWVLSGSVAHGDSLGHSRVLRAGEMQVMTAGNGVRHSETNPSEDEPVHFLQIWLRPQRMGGIPDYRQARIFADGETGIRCAAGPEEEGILPLAQDARIWALRLPPDGGGALTLEVGRQGYLHVAKGAGEVLGQWLDTGDGAHIAGHRDIPFHGGAEGLHGVFLDLP